MENIQPGTDENQQQQQQQRKRRRQQIEPAGPAPPPCEFELERQRRIQRNRQILADMGVYDAAAAVQQAMNKKSRARATKPQTVADAGALQPSRRSNRIASAAADGGPAPSAAADAAGARKAAADDEPDVSCLLTQAEYFARQGQQLGFESDGHFKGWVPEDICELYSIAADPDLAWQAGGGGAFSRRPDMSAVPAELKQRGWSDAKAFAATQLRKNPNSFFYRHVAPHQQQANGEWSDAEQQRFMDTAWAYGCGDKWGLFASHIGSRVGYQCSAFYRDVILARGLIIDKRFKMTAAGRVVFVGP